MTLNEWIKQATVNGLRVRSCTLDGESMRFFPKGRTVSPRYGIEHIVGCMGPDDMALVEIVGGSGVRFVMRLRMGRDSGLRWSVVRGSE